MIWMTTHPSGLVSLIAINTRHGKAAVRLWIEDNQDKKVPCFPRTSIPVKGQSLKISKDKPH